MLVPADLPFETIDDLVEAWKADPARVVGGGSSPGGPDHLFPMQLASVLGIQPRDVRYITYDGGGPPTTALLGGKIQVGFSGLGESEGQIESGDLRALAVSGEERLDVEWQLALKDNGWIDTFKTGKDFDTFLTEQDERVASTLEGVGTHMSVTEKPESDSAAAEPVADKAQFGFADPVGRGSFHTRRRPSGALGSARDRDRQRRPR